MQTEWTKQSVNWPDDRTCSDDDSITDVRPHLALAAGTLQRMALGQCVSERQVLLGDTEFCL